MSLVYLLTNLVTGKCYVGKTERTLDIRWDEHLKCARYDSSLYLHRAIRKYGKDSFEHIILQECFSKKDLSDLEIMWIDKLKTLVPNGYNMTKGGDGVLGFKPSLEMNVRNSLTHIGKTQSIMACDLKSNSMRKSSRVKRKKVKCIDLLGRELLFDSISSAEQYLNKPNSATLISRCCKGKTKKAYGYIWLYLNEEDKSLSMPRKRAIVRIVQQHDKNSGVIIKTHTSIAAAMRSIGKTSPAIRNCCHKKLKTAHGFIWSFK